MQSSAHVPSSGRQLHGCWLASLLILGWASPALPVDFGKLYVITVDSDEDPVRGVVLTLTKPPRAWPKRESDQHGKAKFPELCPGDYHLKAELEGFNPVEDLIVIDAASKITRQLTMTPAAVEEAITVTSETPLISPLSGVQATNFDLRALQELPSGELRHLLVDSPGIVLDRMVSGGQLAADQPALTSRGAPLSGSVYRLDGIELSEILAFGTAPAYQNLSFIEQARSATGGADSSLPAAGALVSLITRVPVTNLRFAGHYTESRWQSDSDVGPSRLARGQVAADFIPNKTEAFRDYGGDLGGSFSTDRRGRDRLGLWAGMSRRHARERHVDGQTSSSELESVAGRLSDQPTPSNFAVLQFSDATTVKRGDGAGPDRALETTWSRPGSRRIWKVGDTHTWSKFHVAASWASVDEGFNLHSRGTLGAEAVRGADGVWRQGFLDFGLERASEQISADGSVFWPSSKLELDLSFGIDLRGVTTREGTRWPGREVVHVQGENFGITGPREVVIAAREGRDNTHLEATSAWAEEALRQGRNTWILGLRYDRQRGEILAASVAANRFRPDVLPAVDFSGSGKAFHGSGKAAVEYQTLSPRLGLTRDLTGTGSWLLRASYARFPDRLERNTISHASPTSPAFAYFFFDDSDGDGLAEPGDTGSPFYCDGCDLSNPGSAGNPNRLARKLRPPLTDEIVGQIEHAFQPRLVGSLSLLYRRRSGILEERRLIVDEANLQRVAVRGRLHSRRRRRGPPAGWVGLSQPAQCPAPGARAYRRDAPHSRRAQPGVPGSDSHRYQARDWPLDLAGLH